MWFSGNNGFRMACILAMPRMERASIEKAKKMTGALLINMDMAASEENIKSRAIII